MLWLHTFAERFDDPSSGRPVGRVAQGTARSGAPVARQGLPEAQSVSYDPASATLTVGSGTFVGVRPEVLEHEQGDLLGSIATGPLLSVADLEDAQVLPVPRAAQKPAPETEQATLNE